MQVIETPWKRISDSGAMDYRVMSVTNLYECLEAFSTVQDH